jgi:predicted nucleotidyltransferase
VIADTLARYFENQRDGAVLGVWLFGSQASRPHRESDIDVAVLLDRAVLESRAARGEKKLRIAGDLIGVLHRNDVDLVVLNDAPPLFARSILASGTLLYGVGSQPVRDFIRDVQLRAADLEPFILRGRRRLLEVLRR